MMQKEKTSRVKIVISKNDPSQNVRIEVPEQSRAEAPSADADINRYAFILKKYLYGPNHDPEKDDSVIDIINPDLWDLLKSHLGWYPDHVFRGPPVTLRSPYQAIVFSWDKLKEASQAKPASDDDKQARDDLKRLLGAI